ncbi:hypothetical protein ES703_119603 [subsurface metagenome]
MRHRRQVRNKRFARRILAQKQRYLHPLRPAPGQPHHILHTNFFLLAVRHLNTYRMFARQRSHNTNRTGAQRTSHIVCKRANLADLNTRRKLQFKHCYNRPGVRRYHTRINTELRQQFLQSCRLCLDNLLLHRCKTVLRLSQQLQRRQRVILIARRNIRRRRSAHLFHRRNRRA